MNVLSLFSGIGGLELGLERAGMTVVGQVEIDEYCRRVLAKHWPEVPRHDDVRTAVEWWQSEPRPRVDLVCGGFPCQDISNAGQRAGIEGERSGLWFDMASIVRALRPRYVLVENVTALLARGLDSVLADLAASGYDADWDCIPASAVGANHRRDRIFIVAHTQRDELWEQPVPIGGRGSAPVIRDDGPSRPVADTNGTARPVAAAIFAGVGVSPLLRPAPPGPGRRGSARDWWAIEPDVGRVAHGIPARMDRLRALGNAVVPQVAEHVGRLILAAQAARAGP